MNAVSRVVRLLASHTRERPVLAIDGPSGSGKTTLAADVADALTASGRSVTVVHMDDLYPGWDGLAEAPGLLVTQILTPWTRGEPAHYRAWDWHAEDWGETRAVPPADVLIVEGCGSSVGVAGELATARVWLEADDAIRFRRGIERDGDAFAPHWRRWMAQEAAIFALYGTRGRADLILDTS